MPYMAKVTFTYALPEGGQGWVQAGSVLPDDAEVVQGREALFTHEPAPTTEKRAPRKRSAK